MPTTTLTMSPTVPSAPFIPIKLATTPLSQLTSSKSLPSPPTQPHSNTAAILRPLYARAARAFLHRDIILTHSLLSSAFALISPPSTPIPDSLTDHRRKWDVLRITLEVTVYTAPPADTTSIPAALRANALLSATALLASFYARSLHLFAPADGPSPNSAFLPPQVLVTLALSSAKIGCPAAGREIVEEWLACRTPNTAAGTTEDGYEKVLEVYLLSILPALGDWTYAKQFIGYETELPVQNRERLAALLASLHEQHLASLVRESPAPASVATSVPTTPKPTPAAPSAIHRSSSTSSHTDSSSTTTPTPSRPSSPTPSSSSASSNSTHTAVPTNPHPRSSRLKQPYDRSNGHAMTPLTPTPSSSVTHEAPLRASFRAQTRGDDTRSSARRSATPSTAGSRPGSWHVLTRSSGSSSLVDSMHAALRPYIRYTPLFLLCVVLPALAMLLRSLRRRSKTISSSSVAAAAATAAVVASAGARSGAGMNATARTKVVEEVRKRLSGVQARRGLLGTVWDETVRAIWDTVAMGGRGLV